VDKIEQNFWHQQHLQLRKDFLHTENVGDTTKNNEIFLFSINNNSAFILHMMECLVSRDNDIIPIILLEAGLVSR